jgi:hypothetical protein
MRRIKEGVPMQRMETSSTLYHPAPPLLKVWSLSFSRAEEYSYDILREVPFR